MPIPPIEIIDDDCEKIGNPFQEENDGSIVDDMNVQKWTFCKSEEESKDDIIGGQ